MELQVKRREGEVTERCPYCHDFISEVQSGELVTCPGCGTLHHEVCLQEIGRCTIHGCGRPILIARPDLEESDADRSPAYRELRRRLRERARTFVRRHCRAAEPGQATPAELRRVLALADEARREKRWVAAARSYEDADALLEAIPHGVLDAEGFRVTQADVRALSGLMWGKLSGLEQVGLRDADVRGLIVTWALCILGLSAITMGLYGAVRWLG